MSQWVMNKNGNVQPIQILRKLRDDVISCQLHAKERDEFDVAIQKRHGTSISPPTGPSLADVEPTMMVYKLNLMFIGM